MNFDYIENIWTLQAYCVNTFNMNRRDIEKAFDIDNDLDTFP